MHPLPTEHVEDVDHEYSQVVRDCLCTPVILRIILRHFSNVELLKLSRLNKLWNHEARSVLRDRRNVTAELYWSHYPCQNLKDFTSDIRQMNVVPFSGIKIDLFSCHDNAGCAASFANEELDASYDVILQRLQLKYLYIGFPQAWEDCKNCPAFLLVKKILKELGGVVENFSIFVNTNRVDFIQEVLQDCNFGRLKELELLEAHAPADQDYRGFVTALVSSAPNLQVLYAKGQADLMRNLLEGSSALLVANGEVRPCAQEIPDGVLDVLKIKRLILRVTRQGQDISLDRILRITPRLLQASRTTLSSMHVDALFLAPLMCYGISLRNVQELLIFFDGTENFQPLLLKLVKEFDFTRIFPRLTIVDILVTSRFNAALHDQINEIVEQWNPSLKELMPDRAVNIKEMILDFFPPSSEDHSAEFLPQIFPHIQKLSVTAMRGEVLPSVIWARQWVDLTELEVGKVGHNYSANRNLDSVFCGIFPEEVAELRQKNDEYLQAVNIVPVMPSIACFKSESSFSCISLKGK